MLYYFGFFIVLMPVLGLFERTRTLPASISEPVLPSSQGGVPLPPQRRLLPMTKAGLTFSVDAPARRPADARPSFKKASSMRSL